MIKRTFRPAVLKTITINGCQKFRYLRVLLFTVLAALFSVHTQAIDSPILSDDMKTFAVLGTTGVSSAGTKGSTIGRGGNVGTITANAITGKYTFKKGPAGSKQSVTQLANDAQAGIDPAIDALQLLASEAGAINIPTTLEAYQSVHGGSIAPGTYKITSQATDIVDKLTLDGGGDPNSVWIFVFSTTFITGVKSHVTVKHIDDGSGVGLFWVADTGATLNGKHFEGNVLAQSAITSDGGLKMCGRLLAGTAVTLYKDTIDTDCNNDGYSGSSLNKPSFTFLYY